MHYHILEYSYLTVRCTASLLLKRDRLSILIWINSSHTKHNGIGLITQVVSLHEEIGNHGEACNNDKL